MIQVLVFVPLTQNNGHTFVFRIFSSSFFEKNASLA